MDNDTKWRMFWNVKTIRSIWGVVVKKELFTSISTYTGYDRQNYTSFYFISHIALQQTEALSFLYAFSFVSLFSISFCSNLLCLSVTIRDRNRKLTKLSFRRCRYTWLSEEQRGSVDKQINLDLKKSYIFLNTCWVAAGRMNFFSLFEIYVFFFCSSFRKW